MTTTNPIARIGVTPIAPRSQRLQEYIAQSRAVNTVRAYRSDCKDFEEWCRTQGCCPLPAEPETVALYLTHLADLGRRASTMQRRLAAISVAHQFAGVPSPTQDALVRAALQGIRREHTSAQERKQSLRAADLKRACGQLPQGIQGIRDRAILLLGYAGAFRRSELAALNVEDVEFVNQGARVTLRRSKTDQEGQGTIKAIGYGAHKQTCPVRALQTWLRENGQACLTKGPLFRPINRHGQIVWTRQREGERVEPSRLSAQGIALVVKRAAERIGLEAAKVSGHSLRAGFVTDQYQVGTPEAVIMQQTGHRSRAILSIYRREADLFAVNFTAAVGL